MTVDDYSQRGDTTSSKPRACSNLRYQRDVASSLFHCFNMTLTVDHRIIIHEPSSSYNQQIIDHITRYINSLPISMAMIDGTSQDWSLLSIDKTFANAGSGSGGGSGRKKKAASKVTSLNHDIQLLGPMGDDDNDSIPSSSSTTSRAASRLVHCSGTLVCRAYVHGRHRVEHALTLIKRDAVSSLTHRLQLMTQMNGNE
jgi:hypothetical protein